MASKFEAKLKQIQADIDKCGKASAALTFLAEDREINGETVSVHCKIFTIADGELECKEYGAAEFTAHIDELSAIEL